MAKQKVKKRATNKKILTTSEEPDSSYLLKIVLYVILGAVWLGFKKPFVLGGLTLHGFPVGLCIGLLLASHDKFQIDRKIAYAILIIMAVITSFWPASIML